MKRVIAPICVALAASAAHAQSFPVIHTIDSNGVTAKAALNAPGTTFTTSYKGTNDVTMALVSGGPLFNLFSDDFSGALNPPLLSGFVGNPANGTGSGLPGRFRLFEVACDQASVLQIDFAKPLTVGDFLLFADVDRNEFFDLTAYSRSGNVYTPVSLVGWTHQPFTGQTGVLPNASWPQWNPTGGANGQGRLAASIGTGLNEPGTLLWPDQPIARIVLEARGGNPTGTWEVTAGSTGAPEPGSLALLGLGAAAGVAYFTRSRRA